MTPGCSMARSPRPVVPPPCSSTGGRDRMAGFADTTGPGIPCIASRATGVIHRGHPTDDVGCRPNWLWLVRPLPVLPRPARFISLQMRIGDAQHRVAAGPVAAALQQIAQHVVGL